ncbi:hypothetical protein BGW37DRAFT_472281 [Umbelopsis sp. PMI_123]|nr:hypothetical protein BGW37DRAFT_472281 [Umbelopsis sp. PMI_123]
MKRTVPKMANNIMIGTVLSCAPGLYLFMSSAMLLSTPELVGCGVAVDVVATIDGVAVTYTVWVTIRGPSVDNVGPGPTDAMSITLVAAIGKEVTDERTIEEVEGRGIKDDDSTGGAGEGGTPSFQTTV